MTYCNPTLIPGRPDLIEVTFFGERRQIGRTFFDKVMWLANCGALAFERALADRKAGKLSPFDDAYWERNR